MSDIVKIKKPIADMYIEALEQMGYVSFVDDDGDVEFKIDDVDLRYCALIDEDHHKFIRICCLFFYKLSSKDEQEKVYKACNIANLETKVAKTYLQRSGRSVTTSYECFVSELNKEKIVDAVKSAVTTTRAAMRNFAEAMEKSS